MKTELEKKIVNYFISNRSYFVDQLGEADRGKETWFIYKNDSYNHIAVFANGSDYDKTLNSALAYIRNNRDKLNKVNFEFVILTNFPQNITVTTDMTDIPYVDNLSFIIIDTEKLKLAFGYGKSAIINDLAYILENEKNRKNHIGFHAAPITYSIILINVLIYILTSIYAQNIFNIDQKTLIDFGAKVDYLIRRGQYYRIITCMFLHGGLVHLASNMYSLLVLGGFLEAIYGKRRYLAIYMMAGIFGSIASFLFSESVSVGASGAIFGLLGAALIYGLEIRDRVGKEFVLNIIQVIAVNIIVGLNVGFIDNYAHIGGLLGGIILALFFVDKD